MVEDPGDAWLSLAARAKLTLSLHVAGVRPDGYHLIEAEMVTLDLADELLVRPAAESSLEVSGAASGLHVQGDESNLVLRALSLVGRTAEVRLTKLIPAGAGLGGGSADAAAILRWAGYTDLLGASQLGADVAFCLVGGRARVSGIGELVEPFDGDAATFTLLTPPFGVSTPEVYLMWDELGGPKHPDNDLTAAALRVEPRLLAWRDQFADATQRQPILAGSGGTWFVKGSHPGVTVEGTDATIAVTVTTSGTGS
ncbi:MAG: 4-(cytidine 5'-diphospho)-2-C-methyl-D-erythritol kinase [Acidimicrobiales bacterium]